MGVWTDKEIKTRDTLAKKLNSMDRHELQGFIWYVIGTQHMNKNKGTIYNNWMELLKDSGSS